MKDYLVKGYAVNEKRLQEQKEQLEQLKQTVKLLGNVVETQALTSDEATGLLKVITDYTYALDILDQYDHQVLEMRGTTPVNYFILPMKKPWWLYRVLGVNSEEVCSLVMKKTTLFKVL